MKIVCLGWGSLIWDSQDLLVKSNWENDGPLLPIEFARQSKNGRITLVICETTVLSRVYWAEMSSNNLDVCVESLKEREGTNDINIHKVTRCNSVQTLDSIQVIIQNWLKLKEFDAAIWTGLPPKFGGTTNQMPTCNDVIAYLNGLKDESYRLAKEYVEKTPIQIETEYRSPIRQAMNWK